MSPPPPAAECAPCPLPAGVGDPRAVSLPDMFRTIAIPRGDTFWRKLAAFAGPGFMVAVGYMDPGNWATDIAGGSAFGYELLWVILLSNLMAMLLQSLAAKLGIVTGRDLAQLCRERYAPAAAIGLWLLCEVAIVACDVAEVVGTAIALRLLFGLPLLWGVLLTVLDTMLILHLEKRGFRRLEAFIVALLVLIAVCFVTELVLSAPVWGDVAAGFVPQAGTVADPAKIYIAIGIIGATVMPHNLYLHSSIVQTRAFDTSEAGRGEAVRFATLDSTIALGVAFFINAAILVLAASAFHVRGHSDVAEIGDAFHLLAPLLGASVASILFGVALLAAGQNSTVTATLAGQIVMEGFTRLRLPSWMRRFVTRALAIVPAALVAMLWGEAGLGKLLILSQVVLSLQLPFAVVPLIRMTGDRELMGRFANGTVTTAVAWGAAGIIIALNLTLILSTF